MTITRYFENYYFNEYSRALKSGLITKKEAQADLNEVITERLNKPWACDKPFHEGKANAISNALGSTTRYYVKTY